MVHILASSPTSSTSSTTSSPSRTRSIVHFAPDEQLCSYQKGPTKLYLSTIRDVWYQPHEFALMRASARQASDRAVATGLSDLMDHTYGFTNKKTQELFNYWTASKNTRRGLERFCNREYYRHRMQLKRSVIHAVLCEQARLWRRMPLHQNNNNGNANNYKGMEKIGQIAASVSYRAVKFAEMMGKADYHAAVEQEQPSVAVKQSKNQGQEQRYQQHQYQKHQQQQQCQLLSPKILVCRIMSSQMAKDMRLLPQEKDILHVPALMASLKDFAVYFPQNVTLSEGIHCQIPVMARGG